MMGKRVIAECVEDAEIAANLAEIGVDYGQGYGVAQPRPFDVDFRASGWAIASGETREAA